MYLLTFAASCAVFAPLIYLLLKRTAPDQPTKNVLLSACAAVVLAFIVALIVAPSHKRAESVQVPGVVVRDDLAAMTHSCGKPERVLSSDLTPPDARGVRGVRASWPGKPYVAYFDRADSGWQLTMIVDKSGAKDLPLTPTAGLSKMGCPFEVSALTK